MPTRDPDWRPSPGDGAAPTYTPALWACDRCGALVANQPAHDRFHAGLVALWNGRRGR
jgi:hypothetical protein